MNLEQKKQLKMKALLLFTEDCVMELIDSKMFLFQNIEQLIDTLVKKLK